MLTSEKELTRQRLEKELEWGGKLFLGMPLLSGSARPEEREN